MTRSDPRSGNPAATMPVADGGASGDSVNRPLPRTAATPVSAQPAQADDLERPDFDRFTLSDLAAVRNLLRGGSVIDWHQAYFENHAQVDRCLRVNEFDPQSPADLQRLEDLREEAVEYLERHLGFRIPDEVAAGIAARDLFLVASQKGKRRAFACMILKIMQVLQHLAGRELLTQLPISAEQIFHLVEDKVLRTVEEMRAAGFQVVEFEWSRKNANSLITKLLAKRETIAADVYDKLRFRMITQTEDELMSVLLELVHRLVPFNYVIPGQSLNDIVNLRQVIEGSSRLKLFLDPLLNLSQAAADKKMVTQNEFSGPSYRVINFVADLPVRVDKYLEQQGLRANLAEKGSVVYVLTEFQIMDKRTAQENELGENSHANYKERQLTRVRARLMHGVKSDE